jgi:hypothetical protein
VYEKVYVRTGPGATLRQEIQKTALPTYLATLKPTGNTLAYAVQIIPGNASQPSSVIDPQPGAEPWGELRGTIVDEGSKIKSNPDHGPSRVLQPHCPVISS